MLQNTVQQEVICRTTKVVFFVRGVDLRGRKANIALKEIAAWLYKYREKKGLHQVISEGKRLLKTSYTQVF
jgi:hypothetical protein